MNGNAVVLQPESKEIVENVSKDFVKTEKLYLTEKVENIEKNIRITKRRFTRLRKTMRSTSRSIF